MCILALKEGHTVRGVDNARPSADPEYFAHPGFAFSEADLRDYSKAVEAIRGSEAIIHLAAIPTPTDYLVDTHNT